MPGFAVTRGLGPGATPSGLIARGFATEEFVRLLRGAFRKVKKTKHQLSDILEELKVSVSLIAINGKDLVKPIINTVRSAYKDELTPQIQVTPTKLIVRQSDIKVKAMQVRNKNVNN